MFEYASTSGTGSPVTATPGLKPLINDDGVHVQPWLAVSESPWAGRGGLQNAGFQQPVGSLDTAVEGCLRLQTSGTPKCDSGSMF